MIKALLPSLAMRRLLPEQRRRAAPWIIGLMTFVSLVVGVAGAVALGAIGDLGRSAEGRWSLQVTGTPAQAAQAEALLRGSAEVTSVQPVPEAEVRTTLRRWLGPGADTLGLPLPTLGEVTLRPGANGEALAQRLEARVSSARLTPYSRELAPLLGTLESLATLVIGLLFVLAAALAAAVTLAARATLDANRQTLDVLHGIGATDDQLLSLVQRRIALDALVGSLAGATAAILVVVAALIPARGLLGGWGGAPSLSPIAWVLLALLPLLQAGLATLVARRALRQALTDSP
ncbi:cell division protein [Sphingomonas sp. LHG3406-1]|uniref:cell division protein n=1 Tax=Sphingomonas sp. LHG3406-1 TaxID=2804617 RepID=UPI0026209393|nr:cell division protein [Sphingomonas sp. LHG3406-1]